MSQINRNDNNMLRDDLLTSSFKSRVYCIAMYVKCSREKVKLAINFIYSVYLI